MLENQNLSETVSKIYYERKKTYSEADFRIKCDYLETKAIVEKILKFYDSSRN